MTWESAPTGPPVFVRPGDMAIVHCTDTFTFGTNNPLRLSDCLMCDDLIGHRAAAVIGAAVLAGPPCACGGIASDVFLIHADHLPVPQEELAAAVRRGLLCGIHKS